jgi:hypothetical protein
VFEDKMGDMEMADLGGAQEMDIGGYENKEL